MYYFLFFIYLIFFCFLITRIKFVQNSGLNKPLIIGLFLIKVSAGLFLGWITFKLYPQGSDYKQLSEEALKEFTFFKDDPINFIKDIFQSPYGNYDGFFSSSNSYWNNLRNNLLIKFVAILNIFSNGNFYINILFFNFFGFFGHVALYRLFANIYSNKKTLVLLGAFLLPSTLYFSSSLQKDNIIFLMTAFFTYALYFNFKDYNFRRLVLLFISAIVILLIRNYVLFALLPPTFAYLSGKKIKYPFAIVYSLCFAIVAALSLVPSLNILQIITNKQQAFFNLETANSQIILGDLQPTIKSFFINFPQVFKNIFLNPMPWNFSTVPGIALGMEWIIFIILFIIYLFKRNQFTKDPFITYSILFSISALFIAGYIVPNLGSLLRYKSLYLPYIIIPLLCSINFNQIKIKNI